MMWETKRLDELGKVVTGKTPATKNPNFYGGDYMFVTPTDLEYESYYVTETHSTVTGEARASHKNQFIPRDSVMFTCIGNTIGKCGLASAACLTNQQINSIVVNGENNPKFVYYLLNRYRPHIRGIGLSGGAAQPIINKSTFSAVKIQVPNKKAQDSVADILSAYDDLIENNRRRIALLERAARELYREWFVRLRFPGHEHTKVIDGVPEGWERCCLGDALTLQRGFDLPMNARKSGSVPVYGSTGIVGYHDVPKIEAPAIITGRSGSLGTVFYVAEPCWPLNTSLWVKELKQISALYALFMLREMKLEQFNGGVSVPTLDRKVAHRVSVLVPPKRLISNFDEFTIPLFGQMRGLKKQNRKLAQARDLLLPRLMDGRISV